MQYISDFLGLWYLHKPVLLPLNLTFEKTHTLLCILFCNLFKKVTSDYSIIWRQGALIVKPGGCEEVAVEFGVLQVELLHEGGRVRAAKYALGELGPVKLKRFTNVSIIID